MEAAPCISRIPLDQKHHSLFRINADGKPAEFGELMVLDGRGSRVSPTRRSDWLRDGFADGRFPGVPWFLDDLRPQGFLGRHLARRSSRDFGLPSEIDLWDDDAVLTALLHYGENAPGNFVLGDGALERFLQMEPDITPVGSRAKRYAELAVTVLSGGAEGPWVGGEQPKFTACVADESRDLRHVIVKFSDSIEKGPAARRWADLLICEHIAGELLAEQQGGGAQTELVWSQGQLCLEVTRFDRVGARGRRGSVTLAAWSDAHDGERDGWPNAMERMHQGGWICEEAREQVKLRWWFGRMIANTDMHFGNLSFFLDDVLPLQLTPSYDMLPMLYRPASSGDVVAREFRITTPTPADLFYWNTAAVWAELYWQRVAQYDEISSDFRRVAESNGEATSRMRQRFGPDGLS